MQSLLTEVGAFKFVTAVMAENILRHQAEKKSRCPGSIQPPAEEDNGTMQVRANKIAELETRIWEAERRINPKLFSSVHKARTKISACIHPFKMWGWSFNRLRRFVQRPIQPAEIIILPTPVD